MKLIKKIKQGYRHFADDEPGQRFINFYTRIQAMGPRPVVLTVGLASGVVLAAGGFLLGLVPGVPGIVLGILGIALIAAQFPKSARACDVTEMRLRREMQKIRGAKAIEKERSGHPAAVIETPVSSRAGK